MVADGPSLHIQGLLEFGCFRRGVVVGAGRAESGGTGQEKHGQQKNPHVSAMKHSKRRIDPGGGAGLMFPFPWFLKVQKVPES